MAYYDNTDPTRNTLGNTGQQDAEAYEERLEEEFEDAKEGIRDEAAVKKVQEMRQDSREKTDLGAQPANVFDKPEGVNINFNVEPLTIDTEAVSKLAEQMPSMPLTREDGTSIFEGSEKEQATVALQEETDVRKSLSSDKDRGMEISQHPEFERDKLYIYQTEDGQDLLEIEQSLLGNLKESYYSVGSIQGSPAYAEIAAIIKNINENYPDIARIYGGEDGIITIDEALELQPAADMGGYGGTIGKDYTNLLTQRLNRRIHALTPRGEMGTVANKVEAGNRFKKGTVRFVRDFLTIGERIADTVTGQMVKVGDDWVDKKTGESWTPDMLNWTEFGRSLRDYNPWTKSNRWGGAVEFVGYNWLPTLVTWKSAPKGFFTKTTPIGPFGRPLTIGGKTINGPASAMAFRDSLLFLPSNILKNRSKAGFGHSSGEHWQHSSFFIPPAAVMNRVSEDKLLNEFNGSIPQFTQTAVLLANGEYNHPTVSWFLDVFGEQSVDYFGGYTINKLGGLLLRPVRNKVANIFGIENAKYIKNPNEGQLTNNSEEFFKRTQKKRAIEAQTGKEQVNNNKVFQDQNSSNTSEAGGYKLKEELKQPGQGKAPNVASQAEILSQQNTIDADPLIKTPSIDSPFTPLQTRRMALSGLNESDLKALAKQLADDPAYQAAVRDLKATGNKTGFLRLHKGVFGRTQHILSRIDELADADLKPEVVFKEIFEDLPMSTGGFDDMPAIEAWSMQNVIVADNITGALFNRARKLAISTGNINEVADIWSVDGPVQNILDTLTVALTNTKRSRYLWSLMGRYLNKDNPAYQKLTAEALEEITEKVAKRTKALHKETRDGIQMMFELLKHRNDDELAEGVLEMFKVSDNIHNWLDFEAWIHAKLYGGEFDGKVINSVLLNEMQGVMMNSMLSGPKTPMRALLGTTTNMYWNGLTNAAGSLMKAPFIGDTTAWRADLAKFKGLIEIIPETWKVFNQYHEVNWKADISDLKTRYSDFSGRIIKQNKEYEVLKAGIELRARQGKASAGEESALGILNAQRWLNDNRWTTRNIRLMASIDDTSRWMLARARSKEKAIRQILDEGGSGLVEIKPQQMKRYEELHFKNLLDKKGNIDVTKDSFLKKQFEEITLTEELDGLARALDHVFRRVPALKPFYFFARTGVNGMRMSFRNTPLLNLILKEQRDILFHKGTDLKALHKYGIENIEDLASYRSMILGKQALGTAVVMTMAHKYMNGELTGDGPVDPSLRKSWERSNWRRNTISFGGVRFEYTSLEPFNLMLSMVANIGDNATLMGDEWAEQRLKALAIVIGSSVTSKTYLSGLNSLMELTQFRGWNKTIANMMNNSLPEAALRNELGKLLNPHMKELDSSLWASLRNRNQLLEPLAKLNPWDDPLLPKTDILDGRPIKDWHFIHRAFNMVSPIQVDYQRITPGRHLLKQSGFDMKSTIMSYDGYNMSRNARVRAKFTNAIGNTSFEVNFKRYKNLEDYLDTLAKDPHIKESIKAYIEVANGPQQTLNLLSAGLLPGHKYAIHTKSGDWGHNDRILAGFEAAMSKAWASISDDPEVMKFKTEQDGKEQVRYDVQKETSWIEQQEKLFNKKPQSN